MMAGSQSRQMMIKPLVVTVTVIVADWHTFARKYPSLTDLHTEAYPAEQ